MTGSPRLLFIACLTRLAFSSESVRRNRKAAPCPGQTSPLEDAAVDVADVVVGAAAAAPATVVSPAGAPAIPRRGAGWWLGAWGMPLLFLLVSSSFPLCPAPALPLPGMVCPPFATEEPTRSQG